MLTAASAFELSMTSLVESHPFVGEFEGKDLAVHPNGENVSARLSEQVGKTSSF